MIAGCACTASAAIDTKRIGNITSFGAVLKIYICFSGFVNIVTISMSVFLSVLLYLYLVGGYLPFVLEAIIKNNKITNKKSSKMIILRRILYKIVQGWGSKRLEKWKDEQSRI